MGNNNDPRTRVYNGIINMFWEWPNRIEAPPDRKTKEEVYRWYDERIDWQKLASIPDRVWLKEPNFGRKSLAVLHQMLADRGIAVEPEPLPGMKVKCPHCGEVFRVSGNQEGLLK